MLRRSTVTIPVALCAMIFSTGCAGSQKKEKLVPVVRQPAFVGTISLVNPESHFALIDNGLLPTPPAGLVLKSYTNGAESAELVVSSARRRPFAIADIRQGTPQKGDRVYVASSNALPAQPVAPPAAQPAPTGVPGAPPEIPDFLPPVQLAPTP